MNHTTMKTLLLCAALTVGAAAQAKNDKDNGHGNGPATPVETGPSAGNASADDVTLEKTAADAFAFSTVNPMQHGGNTNGFAGAWTSSGKGTWNVLGTVGDKGTLTDTSSLFDFSFSGAGTTGGTWTITNTSKTQNAVLDLTVAIHASNASTAFLFDNQAVAAGQTLSGSWQVEWFNNGGNAPDFSNLVFFGRDVSTSNATLAPVPEPEALSMMLAGFGVLGAAAWRRRARRNPATVA